MKLSERIRTIGTKDGAWGMLADEVAQLEAAIDEQSKFAPDGQAVDGPRYWLDRIESMERARANLQADHDEYRNQYHMAEVKVMSRDALLEQLTEEQLTKDVAQLEAENEMLRQGCGLDGCLFDSTKVP